MIVVMQKGAGEAQVAAISELVAGWGLKAHVSQGAERTVIGLIGDEAQAQAPSLEMMPGVEKVMPVLKPTSGPVRNSTRKKPSSRSRRPAMATAA